MPKNLRFTIELLESDAVISRKILQSIVDEFNSKVNSKIGTIRNQIAAQVTVLLQSTEIYMSLTNGDLAGHFGLPLGNRTQMVNQIVQTIANNLEVEYKPVKLIGDKFANGLTIGVLIKNFTDILSLSEAIVTTEKGQSLPWLNWLLLQGSKMIISEHEIHLISGKGRSGLAIMVKNNASIWRVPTQYSGTINNNWLTRAFVDNKDKYLDMISQILEKELQ